MSTKDRIFDPQERRRSTSPDITALVGDVLRQALPNATSEQVDDLLERARQVGAQLNQRRCSDAEDKYRFLRHPLSCC